MTKPTWRKSSFSTPNQDCVEAAVLEDGSIGVRDSKLGDNSPVLTFNRTELAALVAGIRAGEFDDLA